MKKVSSSTFWQTTFAFTFLVNLAILVWSIVRWSELKVVMWRSVWIVPLVLYLAALTGCVWLFFLIRRGKSSRLVERLEEFLAENLASFPFRVAAGAVFIGIAVLIPWLKFSFHVGEVVKKSTQDPVLTMIVFYWVVWWLVLAAGCSLKLAFKTSWAGGFAWALVLLGMGYEIFIRSQAVTTYPFSMGWSEASRYYYGSLYFAQSIYGMKVPLPTLHPSRYLLQSLPFFFSSLGLSASRLWQFLLWIGLSAVSAGAIVWRTLGRVGGHESRQSFWLNLLFAGWMFLFILRIGVYYHLELMVFIPLLLVTPRHPWRSLAVVILASAWAGISRVNWFPFPANLATAIYLLEEPFPRADNKRSSLNYFGWPAAWLVAGLATALAAQAAYIPLSGNENNASAFVSSFSSSLLWYRLWPNDSYALGILPAILIVGGPLILTLGLAARGNFKALHPLRWAGLLSLLAAFFVGGLVVSVKIGGGADLHNMDAFAVLLAVITAYFIGTRVQADNGQQLQSAFNWSIAASALLIPLVFLIPQLSPRPVFHQEANRKALALLKSMAEDARRNGPVLFITERQLLTFHQINLPLVPEYEAVTLMEMAMSNNQAYLQQFYTDLQNHRFAAIVTGKQNVGIKEEGAFTDENNTWNSRISPYILCYYEPVTVVPAPDSLTYIEADESRIEFYLPRTTPGTCP